MKNNGQSSSVQLPVLEARSTQAQPVKPSVSRRNQLHSYRRSQLFLPPHGTRYLRCQAPFNVG